MVAKKKTDIGRRECFQLAVILGELRTDLDDAHRMNHEGDFRGVEMATKAAMRHVNMIHQRVPDMRQSEKLFMRLDIATRKAHAWRESDYREAMREILNDAFNAYSELMTAITELCG